MTEPGKVKALRALFEKTAKTLPTPDEFGRTQATNAKLSRAAIARHNVRFAARRASHIADKSQSRGAAIPACRSGEKEAKQTAWITFEDSGAFWLPELDEALENDDDRGINKAILNMFFEEHDPQRLTEVESLLDSYQGREESLFLELTAKYPGPSIDDTIKLVEAGKKLEEAENWAKFDDNDEKPILNGLRRPTGVWTINFNPWADA
jgi:hypothetical protein